jgi:hypothetical protein
MPTVFCGMKIFELFPVFTGSTGFGPSGGAGGRLPASGGQRPSTHSFSPQSGYQYPKPGK